MSKRAAASTTASSDEELLKRRRMLYRHNLATLRPDSSYNDGENPYDKTLRDELKKLGTIQDHLSSSLLLARSSWHQHDPKFRIHEFELTSKVASHDLAIYVRPYEESPTSGDTLSKEQLRKAFHFQQVPKSERPYEKTLYAERWNDQYKELFAALNDSEYVEKQRAETHGEWFNDGGVDIFPPSVGGRDWGKEYLYSIVDKSLWVMSFKSIPTTDIELYNAKNDLVRYQPHPFQRKITKPNDGTQHGHQEVIFPSSYTLFKPLQESPDEKEPCFVVAPFEKGAETLHVVEGHAIFQCTNGTEYKLCGAAGSSDRNTFPAYFDADFATATYDKETKTLRLLQSNVKIGKNSESGGSGSGSGSGNADGAEYNGTFNGTNGKRFKMSYNKIVLRDYFYKKELDGTTEESSSKKIQRGKDNISLFSLKNMAIGDPLNIEKECQFKSYSEFLTSVNQICTNARKYYGVGSPMHAASEEMLTLAHEKVQDSRDNLEYVLKNDNVLFQRCRGHAIGERAEKTTIERLLHVYGQKTSSSSSSSSSLSLSAVDGVDESNVLDYEAVKRLVKEMNPGDSADEKKMNFLEWIPRFKTKYFKMMEKKKLEIKAEISNSR